MSHFILVTLIVAATIALVIWFVGSRKSTASTPAIVAGDEADAAKVDADVAVALQDSEAKGKQFVAVVEKDAKAEAAKL